jgi:hypothetical protein
VVGCRWVLGDGGGELDEVGAVVVTEGVAGVVFVEVEVAVEVGGVVAVFDELEDGDVASGVSELMIEGRISGDVGPEMEMGGAEAVVEVVEGGDAVVALAEVEELGLVGVESLSALFKEGFEARLGGVVEPVVDAAFRNFVVLAEGTDGEFAVGFALRRVFKVVVELDVFVELVEVGEGLDEGEGAERVFVQGVTGDGGEVCGVFMLGLVGSEVAEAVKACWCEFGWWEEVFAVFGVVGGA